MTEPFDVRYNEEGQYYEMCIQIDDPGTLAEETYWVPAATYCANYRIPFDKAAPGYTLFELLVMEGWTPPNDE